MNEKQKTIATPVTISGVGLHTGLNVKLTFKPAPENNGIIFIRTDIAGNPIIEANIDYVVDTSRGTTLEKNGHRICTAEHCLAAIAGLSIDNIIIEADGSEMPILDGSSKFYIDALKEAGTIEQNAERTYIELDQNICYTDAAKKIEILVIPHPHFKATVTIDYDSNVLGCQQAVMENTAAFADSFASCRTFVFLHELEFLLKNNLIKGGDLSNAIVFVERVISQEELDRLATLFNKPKISVLKEGMLNNVALRFQNEPARHKVLDIMGDLALLGKPIRGHVIATRPGHFANVEFAKLIKQSIASGKKKVDAPLFDIYATPVFDINEIRKRLPHRPPFLLIDKIIDIGENFIVGLKNVTMNEGFFVGHFPDEPVMPGVLIIEAMAQTGGVLVLRTVPDPENYVTYFLKINNVRFKQKVVPGDTLILKLELTAPVKRGIIQMKAEAFVGNKIVSEAELVAQVVKKK